MGKKERKLAHEVLLEKIADETKDLPNSADNLGSIASENFSKRISEVSACCYILDNMIIPEEDRRSVIDKLIELIENKSNRDFITKDMLKKTLVNLLG